MSKLKKELDGLAKRVTALEGINYYDEWVSGVRTKEVVKYLIRQLGLECDPCGPPVIFTKKKGE